MGSSFWGSSLWGSISWRYFVPNGITSAGLLLGVGSVLASMQGHVETAAWFVLMCVLLDKLDGTVARLLKASSNFGLQLDSFSDFATFGIAPAFAMHAVVLEGAHASPLASEPWFRATTTGVAMIYVLATALRLAKFNVMSEEIGNKMFLGLPTTLCGALVASYTLTAIKYSLPSGFFEALPAIYLVGAILMVSNFPLPKLALPASQPWRAAVVLSIISAYVFGFTWLFPEYLLGLAMFFAVFGFIYGATHLAPISASNQDAKHGNA